MAQTRPRWRVMCVADCEAMTGKSEYRVHYSAHYAVSDLHCHSENHCI